MCHGLVIHLFFTHTQRFVHRRRKVTAAGILGRQVILAARRYTPLAAVSDVALETLRSRRRVGALKNAAQRCRSTTVLVRATEGPIAVLQQTLSRRAALLEAARSHSAGTLTQLLGSATPADNGESLLVIWMRWSSSSDEFYAVLSLLLSKGANVDKKNSHGDSPLALAVMQQDGESARLLIEAGANVNTCDASDGITPLMHAAASSKYAGLDLAMLLLAAGADVFAKDSEGYTARCYSPSALYECCDMSQDEKEVEALLKVAEDEQQICW